jgi:hypothetical protein
MVRCELQQGPVGGVSQFTLPISRASSDRTYPGGCRASTALGSQSPPELTTLILLVPLSICEIACEAADGFLYTDDDRIYGSRWNNLCGADESFENYFAVETGCPESTAAATFRPVFRINSLSASGVSAGGTRSTVFRQ